MRDTSASRGWIGPPLLYAEYGVISVMPVITIRVGRELKERMRRLSHINWSEVVREAIKRRIEEEEERNLAEAVLINERLRRKAPEGWNSVEVIRRWRSLQTPR